MAKIKINAERCKGCMLCAGFCAFGVIGPSGKLNKKGFSYVAVVSPDKCKGCGLCAIMCPECCIEIEAGEEQ